LKQKKIFRFVKFYAKAGEVNTTPPIGPMLGQFPMDVKNFCNMFNNETKDFDKGVLLKVILTLYKDSTFEYEIKSSPLFFLLELSSKILQINYNYRNHRGISLYDMYLITLIKNKDYNLINIKYLFKTILKAAKKSKYKIIENLDKQYYYIYI
jgi:large subunit ribosomal protein L11